ncbi:MAG: T9SS type A sorting domain-containing protein [Prevotella sp.]|nr:T9SS type A sorting domain-containing protein [Prevotella sp.]
MYWKDSALHIEVDGNRNHEPVSVNVYGISGTLVWKGQVTNHAEIRMPKGFYVVRAGKTTSKVSL